MDQTAMRLRLRFLQKCSAERPSMDVLKEALFIIAGHYHICGAELEMIGGGRAAASAGSDITLFENTDAMPVGEPLKFTFDADKESSAVFYFYPAERPFTREEDAELEIYAAEAFLFLKRLGGKNASPADIGTQQLTGIPNGNGYMDRVAELMKKGVHLSYYTAFYFNLKGFSIINRKYGREVGDVLLRQYADSLNGFAISDEVVGHLGSDNFVALIHKSRKDEFLELISDVDLSAGIDEGGEDLHISAVVGVWDIDNDREDAGEVIRRPSIAFNQAKNFLHSDIAVASDAFINRIDQQRAVLGNYERALENREFHVFYQPKVDSRTGTLVGAEGLVRWFQNDVVVSPGIFIPALEQSGNILHLDYYVLRRVCEDIRDWQLDGIDPVPVSVNFSRKDLADSRLAENINAIIEEHGIDKSLIEVELTETTDSAEHSEITAFTNKLYKMGIMVAIDDFGSGYSSVATLREFQVHTIKIDRSFVNSDDFSWKDEIILRDIIHMAGELNIEVLTEGVERDDQLAFVNSVGCYVIQGYYYDKPLPHDSFEERLVNKQY